MNVTLKQIRAFLAIAEHGTFSRAALELHVSQPALSRLIQELESAIELRLIERGSNGTRLSSDGEEFRPIAAHFVREMEQSFDSLKRRSKGIRGTVSIAAGTAFCSTVMPPIIRHCRAAHPGIKISMREDNAAGIVQRVADGGADFGIGSLGGDLSKLIAHPLMKAPLGVVASPQHFSLPDTISLAEVANYPLIHHGTDTSLLQSLNRDPAGAALGEQAIAVASSLAVVLALVAEGIGISVMSALGASALGASGPLSQHLSFIPLSDPNMYRSIYVFYRSSTPLTRAADVVRELVMDPSYRSSLRKLITWD